MVDGSAQERVRCIGMAGVYCLHIRALDRCSIYRKWAVIRGAVGCSVEAAESAQGTSATSPSQNHSSAILSRSGAPQRHLEIEAGKGGLGEEVSVGNGRSPLGEPKGLQRVS